MRPSPDRGSLHVQDTCLYNCRHEQVCYQRFYRDAPAGAAMLKDVGTEHSSLTHRAVDDLRDQIGR